MNKVCELLKKSFYEDEWTKNRFTFTTYWIRKKDGFSLTHYTNTHTQLCDLKTSSNIIIPWYLISYMKYHLLKGQSVVATKKWLDEEEKQNKRYTVFLTSSDLNPWVQESALLSLKEAKEIRKELSRINPKKCYVIFKVTEE